MQLEDVGVLAHIEEVDAEQPGILHLRCLGGQRFRLAGEATQRENGLWQAGVEWIEPDPPRQPGPAVRHTVDALAEAILMSLPPIVKWRYDWQPEPGSAEAKLYSDFLPPRDWL